MKFSSFGMDVHLLTHDMFFAVTCGYASLIPLSLITFVELLLIKCLHEQSLSS